MSDLPGDVWFFTREGERIGPVTLQDLRIRASQGELHPRQDLVWKQGMAEWKPAGEIGGLFERVAQPPPPPVEVRPAAPGEVNPYGIGHVDSGDEIMARQMDWPGTGRAGYFFGVLATALAAGFIQAYLTPHAAGYEKILAAIPWIGRLLILAVAAKRFVNLGMSRWWMLGTIVPFLNLWLGYRLFACPPGYGWHRKMDGLGIFLAVIYWLFVAVGIIAVVLILLIAFGAAGSPELQQEFRDAIRQAEEEAKARP